MKQSEDERKQKSWPGQEFSRLVVQWKSEKNSKKGSPPTFLDPLPDKHFRQTFLAAFPLWQADIVLPSVLVVAHQFACLASILTSLEVGQECVYTQITNTHLLTVIVRIFSTLAAIADIAWIYLLIMQINW